MPDSPTAVTHRFLEGADGVRLHAATAGARGPLMLFLHGFPEFWQAWHGQLAAFAVDHRAVALDLRGYNRSDKPRGVTAYALPHIVDDLRGALCTLSPDTPAIVVGHDWGGIAAWLLAQQSPGLLDRLVIINAPHPRLFQRELTLNPLQWLASSYAGFFQLRGVAEAVLRAGHYGALRAMVFGTSTRPENFSPALRAAYHEAWSQPYALTAGLNYYRNLRALRRVALSADQPVEVPTLVLWGERDLSLRTSNLTGLEQLVPHLTVKRHATATHWIAHEEPAWVNAAIRTFLASEPP